MKLPPKFSPEQLVSFDLGNPKLLSILSVLKRLSNSPNTTLSSEEEIINELEKEVNRLFEAQLLRTKKEQQILTQLTQNNNDIEPSIGSAINEAIEDDLDAISLGIQTIIKNGKEQFTKNLLFKEILHSASISFCIFEPLTRSIEIYNQSFHEFFELIDTTNPLASYRIFDDSLCTVIDDFYLSEEQHAYFEHIFNHSKVKHGLIQLTKLKDKHLTSNAIVIFITDITPRFENEIIKKEKRIVERSLNLKNTFITHFSDEIITPLHSIISTLCSPEISRLIDHQQRIDLQNLKHQCQSLNILIDDVLNDSHQKNQSETRAFVETNLINLIQEVLTTHYFHAISKNVFLDFDIEKEIPPTVTIDAIKLSIILNNLIGSSLKLISKDSKIVVKVTQKTEDSNVLLFEVIRKNKQSINMNPYVTEINPNISGSEIYGLGLPVSEKLVEYLGGKLIFDSNENKYSFQLTIKNSGYSI